MVDIRDIDKDNPHIVKEEDMEHIGKNKNTNTDYDIYNSGHIKRERFLGGGFTKFFRLPLIVAAFLIAAILTVKFIFFHVTNAKVNNRMQNIKPLRDVTIKNNKRFSPSLFNYIDKNKNGRLQKKFKKTTAVRHNNHLRNDYHNISKPIPSKMLVFLKASYKKNILNKERGITGTTGINKSVHNLIATNLKQASSNSIAIPDGTVVNAYIKYKIFSYDTEVPVIAILLNDYTYRGKISLKRGDKFFGTVSVKHSLNRLNISFDKIIKINGHSTNIKAIAMMPNGSGGIKGNVHYPYNADNIVMSLAQGILGAVSIFTGGGSGMNSSKPYTFQNQIRENVAQNELNQAENGMNSYANSGRKMTSITLSKDTPIKIIFLKTVYKNNR